MIDGNTNRDVVMEMGDAQVGGGPCGRDRLILVLGLGWVRDQGVIREARVRHR